MSTIKAVVDYVADQPEALLVAGLIVLMLVGIVWWTYRPVTWQEGDGPVVYEKGDSASNNRLFSFLDKLFRRLGLA